MDNQNLDNIDIKLLKILQENARLTLKEIGMKVNLSATPVFERMKRLEREGYIKKYIAVLDSGKLNRSLSVFCSVKMKRIDQATSLEFKRIINTIPEVAECYNVSGSYDFMLKIHAKDMKSYHEFLLNVLGTIESIASMESTFVMDELKYNSGIDL